MGKLPHLCWAQGHQHLISFSCFVELDCEDWWHHCGKWNNMGTDSQCSVYTHTYSLMSWRERVLWGHPTWTGMAPPTFVSCETLSNQPGFQEPRFLIGKTEIQIFGLQTIRGDWLRRWFLALYKPIAVQKSWCEGRDCPDSVGNGYEVLTFLVESGRLFAARRLRILILRKSIRKN